MLRFLCIFPTVDVLNNTKYSKVHFPTQTWISRFVRLLLDKAMLHRYLNLCSLFSALIFIKLYGYKILILEFQLHSYPHTTSIYIPRTSLRKFISLKLSPQRWYNVELRTKTRKYTDKDQLRLWRVSFAWAKDYRVYFQKSS